MAGGCILDLADEIKMETPDEGVFIAERSAIDRNRP